MHASKQMEKRRIECYCYGVPLQPPSQRLLDPIQEKLNILRQQEALHQALGNPLPFTLGPCPYASGHGQRLVAEFKGGLPPHLGLKRGCYVGPNLGSWPRITSRLLDNDPVTQNPGWLIGDTLLLFSTANRRRRSLIIASRLSHRTSAWQKLINGHWSPFHHLFTLTSLRVRRANQLGY